MTVQQLKILNQIQPFILQYLHSTGQVTPTGELFDPVNVRFENGNIVFWGFPQPQPDFAVIEVSAGFITYLANQTILAERQQATDKFDKEDRRFAMVLIDEINRLRNRQLTIHNLLQANTTFAAFRTAVLNLPTANLNPVTGADLKAAMNNKD